MKISIKDYTFYTSGSFNTFRNNTAVRAAIKAAGGKTTASLALSTTALVVGQGYMLTDAAAKARGLLILDEAQLVALLKDGTLELDDPAPAEEAPRDAHIGELRGVFAQGASSAAWDAIVAAMERCPPEQLDELVAYVEGHISRWDAHPVELRRAPAPWIAAMLQGEESARFKLVRAVSLPPHSMKNAEVIKLLNLTSLTQLTELELGAGNKYAANMWKTLLNAPSTRRLERLTITTFKDEHLKGIGGPHHLDHLKHVTLHYHFSKFDAAALDALPQASWMQRVESITLRECGNYRDEVEPLLSRLPALKRLTIDADQFITAMWQIMAWRLPAEVYLTSRLYMFNDWCREDIAALCATKPDGPTILDLRAVTIAIDPALPEHDALRSAYADALLASLPGSALARGLKELRLGAWWSEPLVEALRRPDLTITR